ncbi:MAG: FG-GAP-like repeat-containing protein, partial [Planctomycetota bacterium]
TPVAAAIDDLNGDGNPDLAVAIPNGTNPGDVVVLLNNGTVGNTWQGFGTTIQLAVGVDPRGIDIGDFDATGGLDIAIANSADGTVQVFANDGLLSPSFVSAGEINVGNFPQDVLFANLDNDKWDDLAVAVSGDDAVRVFEDLGGALYSTGSSSVLLTAAEPVSLVSANLDNDKWDDLAVVNFAGNTLQRFFNLGSGVIDPMPASSPVGAGPMQLIAADLDLDGLPDLATANMLGDSVSVLRSTGAGNFAPAVNLPVGGAALSIAAVNLDPDEVGQGDLDLAVVVDGGASNVIEVLRNDYDAVNDQLIFAPATTLTAGGNPTLVLSSDLNADGQDDLVTVNDESGAPAPAGARGPTPTNDIGVLLQSIAVQPCPGDVDGDGSTGTADITFVVSNLGAGSPGAQGTPGDANGDGVTDVSDITFVVSNLGCDIE